MAELQVLAGAGRVGLGAQRVLHLLDLQLEGVERAEDLLHAVVVVLVAGVGRRVVRHLAGVDAPASSALHGTLHGQRLDDVTGGSLSRRGRGAGSQWGVMAKVCPAGIATCAMDVC